ncbi:MAG: hypothetical protein QOI12_3189 [Alphaproteobacteria bacterium]|jgi:hypothetical protein|nr:hypothetical protein [Alphaproteobacteria bacterium]
MRIITFVAALAGLGLHALPAQAQNTRTFVSAGGSDGNLCSRTAPCRTFAGAIAKTNAGGEINTLEPGGYGTLTIDKAISIVSGLGEAGVLIGLGGTGITITAGANDIINLRGLIIEGAGLGAKGIEFQSGGSLNIQNSVIRNLTQTGIAFIPSAISRLFIANTLISDIGGNASSRGLNIAPSGGAGVTAVLNRLDVLNTAGTAVEAGVGSKVLLRDSTISGNAVGVSMTGGATVVSYGNNAVSGNGTDVQGGTIPEQGARGPVGPQGPTGPQGPSGPVTQAQLDAAVTSLNAQIATLNTSVGGHTTQIGSLSTRTTAAEAAITALQATRDHARFTNQDTFGAAPGDAISFTANSISGSSISAPNSSTIRLNAAGRYLVTFVASVSEEISALSLYLDGNQIVESIVGRMGAASQITGTFVVVTSGPSSLLTLRNISPGGTRNFGLAGYLQMVVMRL